MRRLVLSFALLSLAGCWLHSVRFVRSVHTDPQGHVLVEECDLKPSNGACAFYVPNAHVEHCTTHEAEPAASASATP